MGKKANNLTLVSKDQFSYQLKEKFLEAKSKKIDINDFFSNFLLQFISPETKRAYFKDLEQFFTFIKSGEDIITHPKDIKSYHFQYYRDEMIAKKMAPATINRRLVAIRSFMKWALAANLIELNPLDVVKLPKAQTENPTQAFDDHEVISMIQKPNISTDTGNTHRLMMILLFHLGLRRSELAAIKRSDIVEDRGHVVLRIKGKGSKWRYLPLQEIIQTEIKNYLSRKEDFGKKLDANDYLFESTRKAGVPVNGSTIYRMISYYAKECDIKKTVSPHSCRATAISHLLDTQLTPIRDVAIFAGHSQISTTERYDKRRGNLDRSAAYDVDYFETEKKIS